MATPRTMARTIGGVYLAGGTCGAVAAGVELLRTGTSVAGLVLAVLSAAAVLVGVANLLVGHHLTRGAFHALVSAGTLLISAGVLFEPDPSDAVALAALYACVTVNIFFFFAWSQALVQLVAVVAACATSLLLHPGVGVVPAVVVAVVVVAVALVVGLLARRASGATRDPLTGLPNRQGFDDALRTALDAARRTGDPFSVALVDLDHFARVNEERGRDAADELLRAIAAEWATVLPDGAVLARYGGDEFAVVLPGLTGPEALRAVERLRVQQPAGVSGGVAQLDPLERGSGVLRRADAALLRAKAAGRGRCVLSDRVTTELAADLGRALADGALDVHYQPVVALPGGEVVGMEALVRWHHPVHGPVRPDEFVAVAEAEDLICELGAFVLDRACRDAVGLRRAAGRRLLLTVNTSGRELVRPGYPEQVLQVLADTGWAAADLVLEVTETVVEGGSLPALAALSALRAQGVAVAVDDFGTGYSSLSRLDTVPANYLKLDHSFTSTVATCERRARLLEAVIGLSAALGLELIAEGVETPEQAFALARLGAPLAQGYLFGAPRSFATTAELLAERAADERAARDEVAADPRLDPGPVPR